MYKSGYTADAFGTRGILDSNTTFIQKPVKPEVLVRAVDIGALKRV